MTEIPEDKPVSGFAGTARSLVDSFGRLTAIISANIASSLLTVALLSGLYIGKQAIEQGSGMEAMRVLFTSKAQRQAELTAEKAAKMQAELVIVQRANRIITTAMCDLLGQGGGITLVRAGIIHNGINTLSQRSILRYDIISAQAVANKEPGEAVNNAPLSEWNPYLDDLIANRCKLVRASAFRDATATRVRQLGIAALIACPVVEPATGQLIGGLFASFTDSKAVPKDRDLPALTARVTATARQVGVAYSLKPRTLPTEPSD